MRNRRGNISNIARRRKAKRQKKSAPRESGARKKMLKDSMICRREGKRARFASGLARTPLPSRHIVLHFAPPRSGALLLFRLAFGRVLVGALSASATAARRSATCHNKHTYYCQFGFLRAFSVENHLNLSVGFSSMIKTPSYSQLILLGIKNQEITPLSFRRYDIQKKRCRTCFFSGHLLFINNANSLNLLG